MRNLVIAATITAALGTSPAIARDLQVEITNLTNAMYFTPLLVAAHNADLQLFDPGTAASESLQAMAEGGNIDGLIDEIEDAGGNYVADPAVGFLEPGQTATTSLKVGGRRTSHLSITAMILPTNDGFVGLSALPIPRKAGRYLYYLHGYDAATEANDELLVPDSGAPGVPGIPGDPGGNAGSAGTGVTGEDHNALVHLHRGILGDLDPAGGVSDLDSAVHGWNGPVARLILTVTRRGSEHEDD